MEFSNRCWFIIVLDASLIAARIRQLMEEHHFTQQDLAAHLDISQPAISLYLRGRIPPPPVLLALAQLTGTTVEWILTGTETQPMVVRESGSQYKYEVELLTIWKELDTRTKRDLMRLMKKLAAREEPPDKAGG